MTTRYDQFNDLKKKNSPYLSIDDGESVRVIQLRSMKPMEKLDPKTGAMNAIMHMEMDIETEDGIRMKTMDSGSSRLINVFEENKIDVGSSFLLKKIGEKFDTRYEVSEVVNRAFGTGVSTPIQPSSPVESSETMTDEEASEALNNI